MGVTFSNNSAATYIPIVSQTINSGTSYTFSSISQAFTDLVVIIYGIDTGNGDAYHLQVGNGGVDTGNNYGRVGLNGDGSSVSGPVYSGSPYVQLGFQNVGTAANVPFTTKIEIQNYSSTNYFKTMQVLMGSSTETSSQVSTWRSTSVIDTLKISVTGFASGNVITLYGIKAA